MSRLSGVGLSLLVAGLAGCAPAPEPAITPQPPQAPPPPVATAVVPAGSAAVADVAKLPEVVARFQHSILEDHGASDFVSSLTTEVGARLAGSPGDKLAVAWALRTMKAAGLANVHAEPVKVPVWQRGLESASLVAPVAHKLAITALGWSGATPPNGLTAELVRFDSLDALRGADATKVRGKIAFLDVRMRASADGPGYGEAVVARVEGPREASGKGAIALVIRSIGSDETRFPHTGAMKREKSAALALPAGAISNADADLLERVLALPAGNVAPRLSVTLTPRWLPDADSANVVGEVVGRERPADVVLLGAHLDSWDLGEGAIDDGAGCGIVLEAGRALAGATPKPRRTVRIVLFAAEENSLSGGKAYAVAHAGEAATHLAALEADSGTNRVLHVALRSGPDARSAFHSLAPLLVPLEVTLVDKEAHGGSDISPLEMLGVPVVDMSQDPAHYFDHHHTANDVFARVDKTALSQAAAAFATMAWGIAELPGDFGRIPEAERAHR